MYCQASKILIQAYKTAIKLIFVLTICSEDVEELILPHSISVFPIRGD